MNFKGMAKRLDDIDLLRIGARICVWMIALAVLAVVLATAAQARHSQHFCPYGGEPAEPVGQAFAKFKDRWGEDPRALGVGPDKKTFFFWLFDPQDGSWTWAYYRRGGRLCVVYSGGGGMLLNYDPAPPGEKS